jgi:uncharacterized protein involved in exopolysaccharide biosynthesis
MYEINSQELPRKHLDFKSALQALRRHKLVVLFCLVAAITAAAFFNEFSTPVYEAVATIICVAPKDNILISEGGRSAFSKSSMINLIETLKSRALTREVAQALPEQVIRTFKTSAPPAGKLSPEDAMIGKIQQCLTVDMVPGSDILQIK